jgi:hypothetical protein
LTELAIVSPKMSSPKTAISNPWNSWMLFIWRKIFTDGIKLRTLRLFQIRQLGPKLKDKCPYKKHRWEQTEEEALWRQKWCGLKPRNADSQQMLEETKNMFSSWRIQREHNSPPLGAQTSGLRICKSLKPPSL